MEFQNRSKGQKLELGTEKVIEMKQGSWKQEWDKGEVESEFWYGVAQSVTLMQLENFYMLSKYTWMNREIYLNISVIRY